MYLIIKLKKNLYLARWKVQSQLIKVAQDKQ